MHYAGGPIHLGAVSLCAPADRELTAAMSSTDLDAHDLGWFRRAASDDAILYFTVRSDARVVGEIFLHDMTEHEAMAGYHLFRPEDRGKGYGTAALSALCEFAFGRLALHRLVAITSVHNAASRRIAVKCGFRELGPAREGLHLVCYERFRR